MPGAGELVVTVHVIAPMPLADERQNVLDSITTPSGSEVVVMASGVTMLMAWTFNAAWPVASTARTMKFVKPVAVGVPLITPAALIVRPAGNADELGASDH